VTTSQNVARKRYSLFVLAILLLLLAAACFLLGSNYSGIRPFAGLAVLASVYLVRISNVRGQQAVPIVLVQGADAKAEKQQDRRLWIISLALVPLLGASLLLMYIDALNGGHDAWPAYVFAGVGLVCAGVWGALAAIKFGSK
jgi:hypothetical protein